ncbi:MAG TPA: LPS assembly protein LptD [Blastocatellia bacterium]|nr:LPS assembly protein LptD [Blastocatellia bacterium]HMY71005.1 LPS assembly protein LptD [Blastocatellia bacterium]HMZ18093.1 LPS assembly protein LptD [Blastocatellia bacterium]HNG30637.1 LPS assembly protein LptD [Blastocatellia bacterium]
MYRLDTHESAPPAVAGGKRNNRFHSPLLVLLILLFASIAAFAQQTETIEKKVSNPIGVADDERRSQRQTKPEQITIVAQTAPDKSDEVVIYSEKKEVQGDVYILTGKVQITYTDILVIADRATFNTTTNDLLAEGNVYFEQQGQRFTGERLELNYKTKRGTLIAPTAFTSRTRDSTVLVIDAGRADKTSDDTYELEDAKMTACQEAVPKWAFTAKRARIRVEHRATVYNALLRIKNIPVFYLPYASISISKKDRSSGFLLPTSGSSNIKGRTLQLAYYQTLGRSADVRIRTDIFSRRGIGMGFDFRARTNETSHINFGSFLVFDRLFGEKGDDQGGSSFYAEAVHNFKNGFVAVADVNITSNFLFRQIFSDDILSAISPEERSLFYLNKNWRSFSFNGQFGEQSSFIAERDANGNFLSDQIVKVRKFPSLELSKRSTRVSESLPFYFSFDAGLEGVRRSETAGSDFRLKTPSVVQRLDFAPRLTFPLKPLAGFTLTPSIGLRTTFYSDSLDPAQRQVTGQNLFRKYADFQLDLRPPALAKIFRHKDGTPWFKHIIEPFVEYRRIAGIDEFDRTLRVDERDVIANTNEITYGISNSFLIKRANTEGGTPQPHELLNVTLMQKYFFDPTFGGALQEGVRNQFFPINTLSGFAFGGVKRDVSPLNLRARLRPTPLVFADVRVNYDTQFHGLRDMIFGGGLTKGIFSVSQSWYYTRRIAVDQFRFDPSTLPGNQMDFSAFVGNPARGPYGGFTVIYDLRDEFFNGAPRNTRKLINLTTSAGWAWDCCSLNIQTVTFNAGIRNENRIVFAFTLKGIGSFGTESFGQRRR